MQPSGVHELSYRLDCDRGFSSASAIDVFHPLGRITLSSDVLRIRPAESFITIAAAKAIVAPLLLAWEIEDGIRLGHSRFRFAFLAADATNVADAGMHGPEPLQHRIRDNPEDPIRITYSCYPPVPTIIATPEVVDIWSRWGFARIDIRETPQAVAYYALTVIEALAGGRNEASRTFSIDKEILREWGRLTSTRGTPADARKAVRADSTPLTEAEKRWLDSAVRRALLQVGTVAAGLVPPPIRFADF